MLRLHKIARSGKTSLVDRFINPTKEEKAGHRELDEDGRKSSLFAPWRLKMERFNSVTVENCMWKIEKLGLKMCPHGSKALLKMIFLFVRVWCVSSLEGHDSRLKDQPLFSNDSLTMGLWSQTIPATTAMFEISKGYSKGPGTRTWPWDPLLFLGVEMSTSTCITFFGVLLMHRVVFKMLCTWPHAGSTQAHSCAGAWLKKVCFLLENWGLKIHGAEVSSTKKGRLDGWCMETGTSN